jgi:alpha-tubulin suppressor-like RCC1 family protein
MDTTFYIAANRKLTILIALFIYCSILSIPLQAVAAGQYTLVAGGFHTAGLKNDGTVVGTGLNDDGQIDFASWTDIIQIDAGKWHSVGLKSDGTVVAVGSNGYGQINVGAWTDIVQVAAGRYHTIGLKSDGTVVAVGSNFAGELNIEPWTNIVQVDGGSAYTVGLESDGTAVAVGTNLDGECDVESWSGLIQISTDEFTTYGLKSDGTVVTVGDNQGGSINTTDWTNLKQVEAGEQFVVALKTNGTVVGDGFDSYNQLNVGSWAEIAQVSAGVWHTVGLKTDGTVIAAGNNSYGQIDVTTWTDIKLPANDKINAMPWISMLLLGDEQSNHATGDQWRVVLTESATGNPEVEFMSLAYNGNQVTATDLCDPDPPIYGTLDGSAITFSYSTESGISIIMTGTVSGDSMNGTFTANGYPAGNWQAQKLLQTLDPKTCVVDTAEAKCYYFPWSDSYGIVAYLEDYNALVQSAVISGNYISGTSPLTYGLNRPGEWQTDPNPIISYGAPPTFPLSYNVHAVFKDSSLVDIPFTITGYETAD